jgi:hypothetical protein
MVESGECRDESWRQEKYLEIWEKCYIFATSKHKTLLDYEELMEDGCRSNANTYGMLVQHEDC